MAAENFSDYFLPHKDPSNVPSNTCDYILLTSPILALWVCGYKLTAIIMWTISYLIGIVSIAVIAFIEWGDGYVDILVIMIGAISIMSSTIILVITVICILGIYVYRMIR